MMHHFYQSIVQKLQDAKSALQLNTKSENHVRHDTGSISLVRAVRFLSTGAYGLSPIIW
jgi:hypothetical protein